MALCSICRCSTDYFYSEHVIPGFLLTRNDYPLYQHSYLDSPNYISPRCLRCYDKAIKKQERKEAKKKNAV